MSNPEYLKAHYDSLETDALLVLWARGGQLEWAEKLLREELKRRDVADEQLSQLEAGREQLNSEIANQHERSQLRAMGGWVALFLSGTLASIIGGLFGARAGLITFAVVFSGYGVLLLKLMTHLNSDAQANGAFIFAAGRSFLQVIAVFGVSMVCIWLALAGKV